MRTKKLILACLVATLIVPNIFAMKKTIKYYKAIYRTSTTLKEKAEITKEISKVADETFIPLVKDIINEQVNHGKERSNHLKRTHDEWVYYAVTIVGKFRISECAYDLKNLYYFVENPAIRGTIVHSIALTGNKELLPWINTLLTDFNTAMEKGNGATKGAEDTIYGIILGLKEFNDPSSFEAIFYACMPNYSKKIQQIAGGFIESMSESHSQLALDTIDNCSDYMLLHQLMTHVYYGNSSDDDKTKCIIKTINKCLDNLNSTNKIHEGYKTKIKADGIKMLSKLNTKLPEAVAIIDKKWNSENKIKVTKENTNAKLNNIEALQNIGTPEAVNVLLKNLKEFYSRAKDGFGTGYGTTQGDRIFIAIIRALGETAHGNEDVFIELERIRISNNFGKPIKREAALAAEKL